MDIEAGLHRLAKRLRETEEEARICRAQAELHVATQEHLEQSLLELHSHYQKSADAVLGRLENLAKLQERDMKELRKFLNDIAEHDAEFDPADWWKQNL